MKITLANLRHSPSLSQETHAYTATVLVDGVRAFEASNHGTGGPDMYHPVKGYSGPSVGDVDAWLKDNTPADESHGIRLDNCLEFVVGDLINEEIARKRLNRLLSAKILVIDQSKGEDALFTYKAKPTPESLARMAAAIAAGKVKGRLVNGGDEAILAEARKLV